jgi:hypothetical protein
MAEMTRAFSVFSQRSEFDNFLYAPIVEERNGMLLSVISALARLEIDPWQEAAELAGLPRKTAAKRLASLFAPMLEERPAPSEAETIAARLIALLPGQIASNASRYEKWLPIGRLNNMQPITCVIFCLIFMSVTVGVEVIASRQAPVEIANRHTRPSPVPFLPQNHWRINPKRPGE